jgi:hypothetical protein
METNVIGIYLSEFIIQILIQVMIYIYFSKRGRLNKGLYLCHVVTFWFFFFFNMIYTGYFGWNTDPINETELWLDNISLAGWITSIVMLCQSIITKPIKKGDMTDETN